jgi:ribosomal-protein-alanine N-acetyltransferase
MAAVIITVRPMTAEDVPAIAGLEMASFEEPWSEGVLRDELAAPGRTYAVAEDSTGRVVGYAGVMIAVGEAHVMTVAVDPSHRTRGIGTRLMLAVARAGLEAGAEHLTLEVRTTNESAIRLYERFGFQPIVVRRNYYRDGDAIVMWALDIADTDYRARLDRIAEEVQ